MMRRKGILSGINYALVAYVLLFSVGFVISLPDARDLIEVHHWHGCWQYKGFRTYVMGGVASAVSLGQLRQEGSWPQ